MSGYIGKQEIILFSYVRQDGTKSTKIVKPVSIMFSEFYFYLIAFEYSGVIEAALDWLPTARVIGKHGGKYTISAEVYGNGIDMWLRSHGELVNYKNS